MSDFPGIPDNMYQYQNNFNYNNWTAGTEIMLCNVPWDSSYRDVVRFDSLKERDAFFASLPSDSVDTATISGMVYLRFGEPIRVNIPFDKVSRHNYLVVKNPLQPVPPYSGRTADVFYYFISDVTFIAPNTTQMNIQLDVWQTYYDRVEFNMCYVNRGHISIANENSDEYNITSYLTEPEGLNIGDEYDIVHLEYVNLQETRPVAVIVSTADLQGDWGTVSNPKLNTAKGSYMDGVFTGCATYAIEVDDLLTLMGKLSDCPWVSQCIISISILPDRFAQKGDSVTLNGVQAYTIARNLFENNLFHTIENVHDKFEFPDRYRHLAKFFSSPYCVMEITANLGGEIILKPECLTYGRPTGGGDYTRLNGLVACTPPDVRAVIYPQRYNTEKAPDYDNKDDVQYSYVTAAGDEAVNIIELGEYIDFGLTFSDFPQIPVVNNMYQYYLASNRNRLAYEFASADWSYNKAMFGAQTSYNQATNNMQTAWANQQQTNQTNNQLSAIAQQKNLWQGVQDAGSSVAGALGSGNAAGAAAGLASAGIAVANTALNSNWINQQNSIQVGTATAITQNNIANQGYTRDTNYDYAAYAAQGDYMNTIQGIQAKVQDARLSQPTTSGQFGGGIFNISEGLYGILIKWKRLKPNFIRQVGDFWLRYGYYVNRWITPPSDLKCMTNFTYWKMESVALSTTEIPELFKETIRGIFEKGVTVWTNPKKMYRIDLADNEPISGVRY